ncbi:dienelactone hydrolase family protein [Sphaerisporangium sp. NPDC005289]|uniref:dienelactone hydrolase family protein n=1 Tax=Sphaerisporangium sp. NPDC005289 TaxID=3155247 RepID=UPI0033A51069
MSAVGDDLRVVPRNGTGASDEGSRYRRMSEYMEQTHGRRVELRVGDGVMGAYLALPRSPGAHPGVIVAHQLFGVTLDIRAVADRIAALGYAVIAPDFFHRSEETGVELNADEEGRARGFALMGELTRAGVLNDVRAAQQYLRRHAGAAGPVGMVGLSMGGHLAYYAATQLPLTVTVVLYAGWLTGTDIPISRPEPTVELSGGITGRIVVILGADDHLITEEQRAIIEARLRAEGVRYEMAVLPGASHAFLSPSAPTFHAAAAEHAWKLIEQNLTAELGHALPQA